MTTTSRSKSVFSVTLNGATAKEVLSQIEQGFLALGMDARAEQLDGLYDSNWPLVVTIARKRPKRNVDQNALYWAWLEVIGDEIGYEKEELHYALRAKFLGNELGPFGVMVPRSTTTASVTEFTDYLDSVNRFAAEQGIALPQNIEEWKAWKAA